MSKAGQRDMLTFMAMRWNQQKLDQLAPSLTHRCQKLTDSQLDEWVSDVKDWAEAATTRTSNVDPLVSRIEVLVASMKGRSQRLYKDTNGSKARAKIHSFSLTTKRIDIIVAIRRLKEEKKILVREMDHHWKSLSKYDDTLKELSGLFPPVIGPLSSVS
ncbi:hypothetical protein ACER0C_002725 [Sarotherodon galilaeus]